MRLPCEWRGSRNLTTWQLKKIMVETLLCVMSTLKNCLISTYLFHFHPRVHKSILFRYVVCNFNVLYVCLFVWGFVSHSITFHSCGDVPITGDGLKILTYTRHSWPLNSFSVLHLLWHESSVHNDISEGHWHSCILPCWRAFGVELSLPVFKT